MRTALPLAAAITVAVRPGLSPAFQQADEGTRTARVTYRGTCHDTACRYELRTADGSARAKDGDYRRRLLTRCAGHGDRVEFAMRVVVRADAVDEGDERFFIDRTREWLPPTRTTVVRRARTTIAILGVFPRVRPCAVCADRVVTPVPGAPAPAPGPQAPTRHVRDAAAASPQLEAAASPQPEQPSSPAPGTEDPAPSYDPALALRVERLTGTSHDGAASAGPVVR